MCWDKGLRRKRQAAPSTGIWPGLDVAAFGAATEVVSHQLISRTGADGGPGFLAYEIDAQGQHLLARGTLIQSSSRIGKIKAQSRPQFQFKRGTFAVRHSIAALRALQGHRNAIVPILIDRGAPLKPKRKRQLQRYLKSWTFCPGLPF
jgi:hypothetical protein